MIHHFLMHCIYRATLDLLTYWHKKYSTVCMIYCNNYVDTIMIALVLVLQVQYAVGAEEKVTTTSGN